MRNVWYADGSGRGCLRWFGRHKRLERCKWRKRHDFLRDEDGFTTAGMAVAMLLALSLLFNAAQVYRVNSLSAEVQDVADAAALAAETQVAEFMLIARTCDAISLSLSLTGLTAVGLGIAALCTPATAGASEVLISSGRKVLEARDRFAIRAADVLNRLQRALPFYAAACAASVSHANNSMSEGSSYIGVAMLVPWEGQEIKVEHENETDEYLDQIDEKAAGIREAAQQAENAARKAHEAKERAFAHDCGDNPSYCMYERAAKLAGLSAAENPLYTSIDAWSFSVPLARARAYYAQRLRIEAPLDASVAEQARSALRTRFYTYACNQLNSAYVHETDESFSAYFPLFPSNLAELRDTELYTELRYPVTESGEAQTMHAWPGCPSAAGSVGAGSIQMLDGGDYETCSLCEFTASSMAKVAAASTSISNGFEHHYEAVALEARNYEREMKEAEAPRRKVKDEAGGLFEALENLLKETVGKRISISPPGGYGVLACAVNAASTSTAGRLRSPLVAEGTLGPRAAIAAATLVDEGSAEGRTVLNSFLDNVQEDGGFAVGAAAIVLDCWSALLKAYGDGQDALTGALESGLNQLPLAGASGLGTWAAKHVREAIEAVGLQPAELGALKPVLVNTAHVAARAEGAAASALLSIKQQLVSHPMMSTDLFSSVLVGAEGTLVDAVESYDGSIEIASIELLGPDGPSIPITITLPPAVRSTAVEAIAGLFAQIRAFAVEVAGVRVWE